MMSLPSILPSKPAIQDTTSTVDEIKQQLGRATNPEATPIFICALDECYRLLPSQKALMMHRKKDHQTEDDGWMITWNGATGGSGGEKVKEEVE
ncbi:hypothetical protein JR316_0000634 [Psilocybe cubensis]|uniref:C2H2-type domain-containing protein n=2 Tax=Psilocybe cubensis TaxID=181762 RepID=A0A8H7Y772_PSICU|nr:hypothetical protein JR316_0000634 [Psilocybe cubensis]KAH9486569.1 hypothetical protein JR316_0000634 [Psilocybe cubensis]